MIACENLEDEEIFKILVEGGADVNAVNNDDKLPLTLIKERLDTDHENEKLGKIYDYLKSQGAVMNWRDLPKASTD